MEHAKTRPYADPRHAPADLLRQRSRRRKHRTWLAAIAAAAAAAALTAGIIAGIQPQGDIGSAVYPMGDMTHEQAQAMLDEQTARSRMTVSLQPEPRLRDGSLYLNFTVPEDNNGWAERIEVEQDGALIYKSGIVQPGYAIGWADAPAAHAGPALATVYAVDSEGGDHGNPVSVEIEIETDAQQ